MLSTRAARTVVLLLGASLLWAGSVCGEPAKPETKLTLSSLPAAVRKTAEEQTKGATIRGISKEVAEGKTVYEIETKANGRNRDLIIGADGTLLVTEEQVPLTALPAPVRATLEKSAGKAKILLIETVTLRDSLAYYEAQVSAGGKRSEIKVGPAGNLIPPDAK